MENVCRLCCSSLFVNNYIFDEESALYLKMSLYLPIKILKNDRLPQKICDKCSCKVNDIYQFCNETIEVQNRLRSLLFSSSLEEHTVDLSRIKNNGSPPVVVFCEQSTQTEESIPKSCDIIKIEDEKIIPMMVVKVENDLGFENTPDHYSDDSEDMSLITLKTKKKNSVNEVEKKCKKKKAKLKDLELLINSFPDETISNGNKSDIPVVKEECNNTSELLLENMNEQQKWAEVFRCCICFNKCHTRSEMLQHYRQHAEHVPSGEQPVTPPPPGPGMQRCPRCRKELPAEQWTAHWHKHWARDRRPFRCALCEKSYRNHHQIFKHGLTHSTGEVPGGGTDTSKPARFVCDVCPERFEHMRFLLAHRTRAHPEAAARPLALRCGTCARHFAHLNSLRRHLRAHSGRRDHLCNVCGKALSSREHLKFHIRIHTGYKPNVCRVCGKGFVKKCNLTLHERVHSGEKPHVCSHCGKAFSQRSTLVIHERYHSGARPYVCALCGRGFVAKGLLSMHLKTTCI